MQGRRVGGGGAPTFWFGFVVVLSFCGCRLCVDADFVLVGDCLVARQLGTNAHGGVDCSLDVSCVSCGVSHITAANTQVPLAAAKSLCKVLEATAGRPAEARFKPFAAKSRLVVGDDIETAIGGGGSGGGAG